MPMYRYAGVIGLAAAAVIAVAVPSCTEPDPEYCTESRDNCNCDKVRGRCVSAAFDLSAIEDPAGHELGFSKTCASASDCPARENPVCGADKKCAACSTNDDCSAKFKDTPVCPGGGGACVECLTKADCAGSRKTCTDKKCVPCTQDA